MHKKTYKIDGRREVKKSSIGRLIWNEFGLEFSQQELLHWGTCRYLMNWIQAVYFILKEIWPLFSISKAKKTGFFYFSWWKYESKSQSKGHEVHWGTVWYLMNWIQAVYFNLKEIWPLFSISKAKKKGAFFTSLDESMKANLSQKAMNFT